MRVAAKLVMMVGGTLLLACIGSYVVVAVLDIPTRAGANQTRFGKLNEPADVFITGSSLTYDGVNWHQVADLLGLAIESWPVPGSSPAEWEQLQRRSPQTKTTFVGVSLYDLNEVWLCDFRAEIVPFKQTLTDLWQSGSDPAFANRLLSCYPRAWARRLFPTVGRSDHVIFGIRDKARTLLPWAEKDSGSDTRLRLAADYTSEARLSDWPRDRLMRRLAGMRGEQGKPWFYGPKHLAFRRLLQQARLQGPVIVIVFPVSPPYREELLRQDDIRQFEASLTEVSQVVPKAAWVRLDRLPSLDSTDYFSDLVHLNMQGRSIATTELLKALSKTPADQ